MRNLSVRILKRKHFLSATKMKTITELDEALNEIKKRMLTQNFTDVKEHRYVCSKP